MIGFSVMIPTYNGETTLRPLLAALGRQTEKDFELLVFDSSSADQSVELAKAAGAKVTVIAQKDFDHGGTRMAAVREASGEFLVFLTQDAVPADEYSLANLLKPLREDASVSAVFGRQLPSQGANVFAEHLRLFNYPAESYVRGFEDRAKYGIKTAFFSDSFSAYRRSAFEAAGGFLPNLLFGEDTCIAAKILEKGGKIAYASEAQVRHSHNYSIGEDFRRYFDMGAFHKMQSWLPAMFGSAEGEGFKYVLSELKFLLAKGKWYLLPSCALRTAGKLFGYKLGKLYRRLPKTWVLACSMHRFWWKNHPEAF